MAEDPLKAVVDQLAPEFDFTIKYKELSYRVPKVLFAAQSPIFHCAAYETGQEMAEASNVFEITADVSRSAVRSFICWLLKIKNPMGQAEERHHMKAGTKKADMKDLVALGHAYQISELLETLSSLICSDMKNMSKEEYLTALAWLEKSAPTNDLVWNWASHFASQKEVKGEKEELAGLSHPLQVWLLKGLLKDQRKRETGDYSDWDLPEL